LPHQVNNDVAQRDDLVVVVAGQSHQLAELPKNDQIATPVM
jgi:hypothetical protein